MTRETIYQAIDRERARQAELWNRTHDFGFGDCSSDQVADSVKGNVLGEEYGEVCRAMLQLNREKLKKELIQVAAVSVAWLEAL